MHRRLLPLLALTALAALPAAPAAGAGKPGLEPSAGAYSAEQRSDARETLEKAEALRAGRGDGHLLSPALKDLAVRFRALGGSDRRRALRLLARPTPGQGNLNEEEYRVPESPRGPFCSAHFCVHWVDTTEDAPDLTSTDGDDTPDYVQTVAAELENSYNVEHGELGWRTPVPDGMGTSDPATVNHTDVYLKQLGDLRIFGYAAPDPFQQTNSQHAYLVLDDDYSPSEYTRYTEQLPPLRVTAAHEYNHVIQFAYDVLQDAWMFESTAVWMEDRVYDEVNDYVSYLGPWATLSQIPITQFSSSDPSNPGNQKVYGSGVWNRWLEEHYGADTIRIAWESSLLTRPASFAPGAYDRAIRQRGGPGFIESFMRFVAEAAEWRAAGFHEGEQWPDMQRLSDEKGVPFSIRADGPGVRGRLDHTAWAYIEVQPQNGPLKLIMTLPSSSDGDAGPAGGAALVGRRPAEQGGGVDVRIARLPSGGRAVVELEDANEFERLTAVIVNADITISGFSASIGDWVWERDQQPVSAHVSSDFDAPRLTRRSPKVDGTGVSPGSRVKLRFSEKMVGIDSKTLRLFGPGNKPVSAKVKYRRSTREATLDPRGRLRPGRRYRVQLSDEVVDLGANPVPNMKRRWVFTTAG